MLCHLFAHLEQSILETVADSSASDMKDTASGSESSRHSIQSDDSFVFISKCLPIASSSILNFLNKIEGNYLIEIINSCCVCIHI